MTKTFNKEIVLTIFTLIVLAAACVKIAHGQEAAPALTFNASTVTIATTVPKTGYLRSQSQEYISLQKEITRLQAQQAIINATFAAAGATSEAAWVQANPLPTPKVMTSAKQSLSVNKSVTSLK